MGAGKIKSGSIKANKVNGEENLADMTTKHFTGLEILHYLQEFDFEIAEGRADKSLALNGLTIDDKEYLIADSQCVIVHHRASRRNLCDPFQCAGAPKLGSLTSTRVTHGTFVDGTRFTMQDNRTCKITKHLDMGDWWT